VQENLYIWPKARLISIYRTASSMFADNPLYLLATGRTVRRSGNWGREGVPEGGGEGAPNGLLMGGGGVEHMHMTKMRFLISFFQNIYYVL
jgi:hypothetical protein